MNEAIPIQSRDYWCCIFPSLSRAALHGSSASERTNILVRQFLENSMTPLAEQRRIVAKDDELTALGNGLKTWLATFRVWAFSSSSKRVF